jgi:hypothetical protein
MNVERLQQTLYLMHRWTHMVHEPGKEIYASKCLQCMALHDPVSEKASGGGDHGRHGQESIGEVDYKLSAKWVSDTKCRRLAWRYGVVVHHICSRVEEIACLDSLPEMDPAPSAVAASCRAAGGSVYCTSRSPA